MNPDLLSPAVGGVAQAAALPQVASQTTQTPPTTPTTQPAPVVTPTPQAKGTNIPTVNNNPGDLVDPATGKFQSFPDAGKGWAALLNDIQGKISGNTSTGLNGNSTLFDFASKWDPAGNGKNDPGAYAASLANQLGVAPNAKLSDLQPKLMQFANAIAKNEGWQGGFLNAPNNSPVIPPSSNPLSVNIPPADTTTNPANGGIIAGNILGSATGGMEAKAAASGVRAVQATPNILKGIVQSIQPSSKDDLFGGDGEHGLISNLLHLHFKNALQDITTPNINDPAMAAANQTMATPLMGQKTMAGSSNAENLESAAGGILQLLGLKFAPALNDTANKVTGLLPKIIADNVPQSITGKLLTAELIKSGLLSKLLSSIEGKTATPAPPVAP